MALNTPFTSALFYTEQKERLGAYFFQRGTKKGQTKKQLSL